MHEPAIAAELIALAQREAERSGHAHHRITSLTVRIGALRGVVEESLCFAFDALKAETPLRHAHLIIENSPVLGKCRSCGNPFEPLEPIFLCRHCGSADLDVQQGQELDLVSLTVDVE